MECELIANCGFFKDYCTSSAVAAGFGNLFCKNKEKSETCERKKFRKAHGAPPPANMAPTGKML